MYLFLTSRCQVSRQANILLTRAKKRKAKKKSLLALHRFFCEEAKELHCTIILASELEKTVWSACNHAKVSASPRWGKRIHDLGPLSS